MVISLKVLEAKAVLTGIMEVVELSFLKILHTMLNRPSVAHPILAGIETKFMASYGRDWLRHGNAARLAMVVESRNINGLKMFDPRMGWQVTSSLFIVCGTAGGAFILSCKWSPVRRLQPNMS